MSEPTAAGFVAGFSARHATGQLLAQAFTPVGFAPADPRALASGPRSFIPADPAASPTAGWNPFDAVKPLADPLTDARAAGYADGQAAARAEDDRDRGLAERIAQALSGRIDRDRIAQHLRQTVLFLVTKIVGESSVSPDLLAKRITAATELLSDAAESAMLRVNPADVALLDGRLPATVFAVGDAAVVRGSFVLESASTIVEDGPELWLDQLAAAIDRVAVPPAAADPA